MLSRAGFEVNFHSNQTVELREIMWNYVLMGTYTYITKESSVSRWIQFYERHKPQEIICFTIRSNNILIV